MLSLTSYPLVRHFTQAGQTIQIETDGMIYRTVSLHTDQTVLTPGPLGDTVVVIQDGAVHVSESPCRAKICIRTGHIARSGQLIVCVPNKVVVRVVGNENVPYDVITR